MSGGYGGDPVSAANTQQVLFVLRSADLQSLADQVFVKKHGGTLYRITDVFSVLKTGGATVVCAGGIYTAASKGGVALIAAAQSWIGLSGAGKTTSATLAAVISTDAQSATPILALTTGSTATATADVFIVGYIVD